MPQSNKNLTKLQIADEKRREAIERAKLLLENIISKCEGKRWAIESLAEVLELYWTDGADIETRGITQELQNYLFIWSPSFDDSLLEWKESFLEPKDTPREEMKQVEEVEQVLDMLH